MQLDLYKNFFASYFHDATVVNQINESINLLKDKKLQVSINEKKEYKVADIDTIIPDENIIITIRGFQGNEKNLTINSFKIFNLLALNRS